MLFQLLPGHHLSNGFISIAQIPLLLLTDCLDHTSKQRTMCKMRGMPLLSQPNLPESVSK